MTATRAAIVGGAWRSLAWLAVLALVAFGARAQDFQPLPDLKSPVTDLTATLSSEQVAALGSKLRAFESRKGSQIAIVLVPTTAPETIEEYSIRLAERAKVGRTKVDDGLIILVAMRDQRTRLEVGYGLEGVIPDSVAARVRREVMNPFFRQGDFFGGLNAGADALMRLIDGEPLPSPQPDAQSAFQDESYEAYFVMLLVLVFVVGGILKAMFGRVLGSAAVGGVAGTAAYFITTAITVGLGAGIVAFLFSLVLGGGVLSRPGAWTGGRRRGGGWIPPGGSWGGGGWSGGDGGGGWSGGGGGFGGGGSSGSWND